jgi:hypothetical protein
MLANGEAAYPHKFQVELSLPAYVSKYKDLADGERVDTSVNVAGMHVCSLLL